MERSESNGQFVGPEVRVWYLYRLLISDTCCVISIPDRKPTKEGGSGRHHTLSFLQITCISSEPHNVISQLFLLISIW